MKHGTQKIIADKSGISSAMISMILNAKKRPSWTTAKKLASATGISAVVWIEGSPEEIRAAISDSVGQ